MNKELTSQYDQHLFSIQRKAEQQEAIQSLLPTISLTKQEKFVLLNTNVGKDFGIN